MHASSPPTGTTRPPGSPVRPPSAHPRAFALSPHTVQRDLVALSLLNVSRLDPATHRRWA